MARNVINILGVSEPEPGGQPRSEVGGQRGRNMQCNPLLGKYAPKKEKETSAE